MHSFYVSFIALTTFFIYVSQVYKNKLLYNLRFCKKFKKIYERMRISIKCEQNHEWSEIFDKCI